MFFDLKKDYAKKTFQFIIRKNDYKKYSNLEYIHPIKQKEVFLILEHEEIKKSIEDITIFGSAKTPLCRVKSDIDICITLKEEHCNDEEKRVIEEEIGKITQWKYDLFFKDELKQNSMIKENIERGVTLV